jgi:hypothetical protein
MTDKTIDTTILNLLESLKNRLVDEKGNDRPAIEFYRRLYLYTIAGAKKEGIDVERYERWIQKRQWYTQK